MPAHCVHATSNSMYGFNPFFIYAPRQALITNWWKFNLSNSSWQAAGREIIRLKSCASNLVGASKRKAASTRARSEGSASRNQTAWQPDHQRPCCPNGSQNGQWASFWDFQLFLRIQTKKEWTLANDIIRKASRKSNGVLDVDIKSLIN